MVDILKRMFTHFENKKWVASLMIVVSGIVTIVTGKELEIEMMDVIGTGITTIGALGTIYLSKGIQGFSTQIRSKEWVVSVLVALSGLLTLAFDIEITSVDIETIAVFIVGVATIVASLTDKETDGIGTLPEEPEEDDAIEVEIDLNDKR